MKRREREGKLSLLFLKNYVTRFLRNCVMGLGFGIMQGLGISIQEGCVCYCYSREGLESPALGL